ncbi:MAG: MBL fold metallo-hydrolase [Pseudomonadota bacterium]
MRAWLLAGLLALSTASASAEECAISLYVLGVGQDAGAPQIGNPDDPAHKDPALALWPTSLALVDHTAGKRYLIDATPEITGQLQLLDTLAPTPGPGLGIDGIFLTHAHIGHYAGLMYLGREAAGTEDLPVYGMRRMREFLTENGPWAQLVALGNIRLEKLANLRPVALGDRLRVTPLQVPHRGEYAETVGFVIDSGQKSVLYVPDIDSWAEWRDKDQIDIVGLVRGQDRVIIDGTFFADGELGKRDMSAVPHPRIRPTMDLLDVLPTRDRRKVYFTHLNHTNPVRFADSPERAEVLERGYRIAERGETLCLADTARTGE